ncbi:MAG: polysaccharide pyruvyl transferase family protein [Methylococcales bacterium]
MMIEIKGVGFVNKGAELMLMAVLQKVKTKYPDAEFVLTPDEKSCPYQSIAKVGAYQKLHFARYGINFLKIAELIPNRFLRRYGLVLESEIDVILDASGLAYSDNWGAIPATLTASRIKQWRTAGKKVILLPQAFGPFTSEKIKKAMKTIIANADLICARDAESYKYLQDLTNSTTIQLFPDFTNLIQNTALPDHYQYLADRVCIITNCRMLDQLPAAEAQRYVPLMADALTYLINSQCKPYFLMHEGLHDESLAQQIMAKANSQVEIIREADPLTIKSIIGASRGVLCSRFHGLVSALSQGVPALGTGWSHKYDMLFADYQFSEGLLNLRENNQELAEKLHFITDPHKNNRLRQALLEQASVQKQRSEQMWDAVFHIMDSVQAKLE